MYIVKPVLTEQAKIQARGEDLITGTVCLWR